MCSKLYQGLLKRIQRWIVDAAYVFWGNVVDAVGSTTRDANVRFLRASPEAQKIQAGHTWSVLHVSNNR